MKIIVTGATGLIGRVLIHTLIREGHQVYALSRSPDKLPELSPANIYQWSDHEIPNPDFLKNSDAIVHLAGEGIADKLWTSERKRKLRDSRIMGTKNVVSAISMLPPEKRPKTFISGSAIGFYRDSSEVQTEISPAGHGFLAELCKDWESAASTCESLGVRTIFLRTGLVLAQNGGLLGKTGPAVLGDGRQWMSWIHIEDLVRFIGFALNHSELRGPFNLTSENPVTNKEFTKLFSQFKHFPFTISVPRMLLKMMMGEMSEAVLANQKIIPSRAISAGFKFQFNQIEAALKNLIGNSSFTDNQFSARQFVPIGRSEVFNFFSKIENLEVLTPPWLNFHVTGKSTPEIRKETLINYNLKIHGVPIKWRTLIKEWDPEQSFVDFQLKGPYRKWHHRHTFEEVSGGTLICDDVTFVIPGWIFGKILLPLVKKDIQEIFNYRQKRIKELFSV